MYGYRDGKRGSELMMEQKKDMKKRGLPSPNKADALALTYAYSVAPRPSPSEAGGPHQAGRQHVPGRALTEREE